MRRNAFRSLAEPSCAPGHGSHQQTSAHDVPRHGKHRVPEKITETDWAIQDREAEKSHVRDAVFESPGHDDRHRQPQDEDDRHPAPSFRAPSGVSTDRAEGEEVTPEACTIAPKAKAPAGFPAGESVHDRTKWS